MLRLSAPLRRFTADIVIRHLLCRIRNFRLAEVQRDHPKLRDVGRSRFANP
jgi:hypothetical protein